MAAITREAAVRLVGKHIYAVRKDGSMVTGKLLKLVDNKIIVEQTSQPGQKTRGLIIPLVLFDLLAIGLVSAQPYGFGGYGGGCCPPYGGGGCGPYGCNPYGYRGIEQK